MIQSIQIHRFILSQNITISPQDGFNVFTGETGAGKTLLINAIRFGTGENLSRDVVFNTEQAPHVQISFKIPENKQGSVDAFPYNTEEWICERYLTPSGKNRTRINGILVPLKEYKKTIKGLISIHGQHDTGHLFSNKSQLQLFDRYFYNDLSEHISFIQQNRSSYIQSKEQLIQHKELVHQRWKELDFLKFQIDEIDKANLDPNEEQELLKEKNLLSHTQHIIESIHHLQSILEDDQAQGWSMDQALSQSVQCLSGISMHTPLLKQCHETMQTAQNLIRDLLRDLGNEKDRLLNDYDKDKLEALVSRLDEIQLLKRKYGQNIIDILQTRKQLAEKLESLEQEEINIEQLKDKVSRLEKNLTHHALALSKKRQGLKHQFEEAVKKELSGLGMEKVQFQIDFKKELREGLSCLNIQERSFFLFENGIDVISYQISTNPGQELMPMNKIASGGELSRIMLSIQSILGHADQTSTLIFDEIDSGIGGQMGHLLGEKLKKLSNNHQVICITHLPQIASRAHQHFNISKKIQNNTTTIQVQSLSSEERVLEITRMTGGNEQSEASLAHAKEMLEKGDHEK